MATRNPTDPAGPVRGTGTLSLFGFSSTRADLELLPRSRGWRAIRAFVFIAGGLLLAPAVGLFPPHAPWATAALAVGCFLGFRKWRERFTIISFNGLCPKCGGPVTIREGAALRRAISVPCDGCNHESRLMVSVPY